MKRISIILCSIIAGIYLLFLISPLIISPILNSYSFKISTFVSDLSGFNVKLEKLRLITTPKLTVGVKIGSIDCDLPSGETLLNANDIFAKVSLIPLLARRIEIDSVGASDLAAELKLRQDGHLLLEEYLPKPDPDKEPQPVQPLPFGFKLSNNLPDVLLKNYSVNLVDMSNNNSYLVRGDRISVSDFVLDKRVKLSILGQFDINSKKVFSYNVKLNNNLMPDLYLNDLLFSQPTDVKTNSNPQTIDVLTILSAIRRLELNGDLIADIITNGTFNSPEIFGAVDFDNFTLKSAGKLLPKSYIKFRADRSKIDINSNLYSNDKELTTLVANIKKGRKLYLSLKSNANIGSLVNIINSIACAFGVDDFKTLVANGAIDADFNFSATKNKLNSNGHFVLPNANIIYKLYNITINNINADVDFNDKLNIKNISFDILGQPLKVYGTILNNSETNLNIAADKLLVKGLLLSAGQVQILKDNEINSGSISLLASLNGKLAQLQPNVDISINNLKIKNKPSLTTLILPSAKFELFPDGKKFKGKIVASNFELLNNMAKILVPNFEVIIGDKNIDISNSYILFNNSKINIAGGITDYLSDKLKLDISATGDLISNDLNSLLPKELRATAKGKMPIKASIKGNLSNQLIDFNVIADPNNYISLLDVDLLKTHNTILNLSARLADDCLKLSNTGIFVDALNNPILSLDGSVNNLSKSQNLNIRVNIPKTLSMQIPMMNNSNISLRGNLDVAGTALNPTLKGLISIPDISIADMALKISNTVLNLNGPVLRGNATVQKLQSAGIIAENLASELLLKNYSILYLNNFLGDAFNGKISGNISYNLLNGKITANVSGTGMNALKTIEGAAGINNALSGTLDFKADINTFGVTDIDIMKNLKGNVSFSISNGKFLNVGRFDNLLYAENILGNAILKTLITSITDLPIIQDTAEFKYIDGLIGLGNGWANLDYIKTSGPLMAYYITGKFNLLNGTTNVVILGRIEDKVVMVLGPLGDLSVDTLTSYIPKFGALTSLLVHSFTSDPENEKVENIPQLSSGSNVYKDFKVVFNGGVDSKSAVKSFKWLSKGDTSAIDLKQEFNSVTNDIKNSFEGAKQEFQNTKDAFKNSLEESKKQFKDAKDELKNLFSF